MEIVEYEDMKEFSRDLKFWCNSLGELHHHEEYDIEESELPKELQRAYNVLWTDGSGSLCYLVEYKENYGVALINEFDEEFAKNNNLTMEGLFVEMKSKADSFRNMEEFKNATVLLVLGKYSGVDECHEFITILLADTDKKMFDKVADLLYEQVYEI